MYGALHIHVWESDDGPWWHVCVIRDHSDRKQVRKPEIVWSSDCCFDTKAQATDAGRIYINSMG